MITAENWENNLQNPFGPMSYVYCIQNYVYTTIFKPEFSSSLCAPSLFYNDFPDYPCFLTLENMMDRDAEDCKIFVSFPQAVASFTAGQSSRLIWKTRQG